MKGLRSSKRVTKVRRPMRIERRIDPYTVLPIRFRAPAGILEHMTALDKASVIARGGVRCTDGPSKPPSPEASHIGQSLYQARVPHKPCPISRPITSRSYTTPQGNQCSNVVNGVLTSVVRFCLSVPILTAFEQGGFMLMRWYQIMPSSFKMGSS